MSEPMPKPTPPSRRTLLARLLGTVALLPVIGKQTVAQATETVLNPDLEPAKPRPSVNPPLHSVPRRG